MTVTISGQTTTRARLYATRVGPWFLDADMAGDEALSGHVTVSALGASLEGTVAPHAAGTFGLQRRVRVVGGAGGWSTLIAPLPYANDAGVSARLVADDAARAVGETIGSFAPAKTRLGPHVVRVAGPASAAIELAAGGKPWWVGFDGLTHVGDRPTVDAPAGSYEVLRYDPREGTAELAIDELADVGIGSRLSERLDSPIVVSSFELVCEADSVRMLAWCPTEAATLTEAGDLLVSIVERVVARRRSGVFRYRVVTMSGDRVDLQPVNPALGLPPIPRVSLWPGAPGMHAELAKTAEVLVAFIDDGDEPAILAFAGRDGKGFLPVELALGGSGGKEAARKDDPVEFIMPPLILNGTIAGVGQFTAVASSSTGRALGAIAGGSPKVKIGDGTTP